MGKLCLKQAKNLQFPLVPPHHLKLTAVFRHKQGELSISEVKFKGFLESNWCSEVTRTLRLAFTTPESLEPDTKCHNG